MLAFMFILGRTWCQWNGWPSGKLSERHAVTGKRKFGIYNIEDRVGSVQKKTPQFSCFVLKPDSNSSVFLAGSCEKCYEVKCHGPADRYPGGVVIS